MLKQYPKTYEDVFTASSVDKRCNLDLIDIRDFESIEAFIPFARKELKKIMEDSWMSTIKSSWLFSKFNYNGKRSNSAYDSPQSKSAFSIFYKKYIGIDVKAITQSSFYYGRLCTYFRDFYVNFYLHNPFEEPEYFKFPYKNISLDYMVAVYQMPERLEILSYFDEEKNKTNYNQFLDWLLNYISSVNEEKGEDLYLFNMGYGGDHIPFVKYKNFKK